MRPDATCLQQEPSEMDYYLALLHGPLFIMQEVLNVRWKLGYSDTANVIQ